MKIRTKGFQIVASKWAIFFKTFHIPNDFPLQWFTFLPWQFNNSMFEQFIYFEDSKLVTWVKIRTKGFQIAASKWAIFFKTFHIPTDFPFQWFAFVPWQFNNLMFEQFICFEDSKLKNKILYIYIYIYIYTLKIIISVEAAKVLQCYHCNI